MFCGQCGQSNTDGLRFCVSCGADLGAQTPSGPADTLDGAQTLRPGDLYDGRLLARRYRIVRRLGSGGMGEVWQAVDTELDEMAVAIKVLPAMLASNARSVKALKREAGLALRLTHPHICRLYNFHADEDVKFLVMEYIDGQTLEALLDDRPERKLTLEQVLPIAEQIAAALDHAHGSHPAVLHRDIKPANIMVTADGAAKLLDFGIAREMKDSMTRVTGQETSGTLLYMSPEQFRGDPPTPASDIYSFAATLYECLAGHPPFHRGSIGHQLLHMEPPAVAALVRAKSERLLRGLAKEKDERPSSAHALIDELRVSEPPPPIEPEPEPAPAPEQEFEPTPVEPAPITEQLAAAKAEADVSISKDAGAPSVKRGSPLRTIAVLAVLGLVGFGLYGALSPEFSKSNRSGVQSSPPHPAPAAPSSAVAPRQTPPAPTAARSSQRQRTTQSSSRSGPSKELTLDLGNDVTMDFVLIPAGKFTMGSNDGDSDEKPPHTVTIGQPFYLSKYEVTQSQWQAVMGNNPSYFKGDGRLPVEQVSWNACQEFCRKLSQKTGKTVRLPSEAEWEYACRAGTTTPFHFGHTISTDQANYDGNYTYGNGRKGVYREKTTPVGSFAANAWGLYDMHGNVWEWCEDVYHDNYDGAPTDGSARTGSGSAYRVLRGGSWNLNPRTLRAANRAWNGPVSAVINAGCRVVVVVGGSAGTH